MNSDECHDSNRISPIETSRRKEEFFPEKEESRLSGKSQRDFPFLRSTTNPSTVNFVVRRTPTSVTTRTESVRSTWMETSRRKKEFFPEEEELHLADKSQREDYYITRHWEGYRVETKA